MVKILLMMSLLLMSCVTPNKWSPGDHQDMMYSLRTICGEGLVKSYDPLTGKGDCYEARPTYTGGDDIELIRK